MSVAVASLRLGWELVIDSGGAPLLSYQHSPWVRVRFPLLELAGRPLSARLLLRRLEAFADRSAGRWPEDHVVTRGIARALQTLREMAGQTRSAA